MMSAFFPKPHETLDQRSRDWEVPLSISPVSTVTIRRAAFTRAPLHEVSHLLRYVMRIQSAKKLSYTRTL